MFNPWKHFIAVNSNAIEVLQLDVIRYFILEIIEIDGMNQITSTHSFYQCQRKFIKVKKKKPKTYVKLIYLRFKRNIF